MPLCAIQKTPSRHKPNRKKAPFPSLGAGRLHISRKNMSKFCLTGSELTPPSSARLFSKRTKTPAAFGSGGFLQKE